MITLNLTEWEVLKGVQLTGTQVAALASSKYLKVSPDSQRSGAWRISATNYVGVITLGDLEVRIRPKVSVQRLLVLLSKHLGHVQFSSDLVDWGVDDDLTSMMAIALATEVEKLIASGLLSGYRAKDESLLTIRGRIDMGRQVASRAGLPLPIEVTYDDFTIDISENRLLMGATQRLLRTGGLNESVRNRLRRITLLLNNVEPTFTPESAETIVWSRLNERYRVSIGLAVLVLRATSIEAQYSRVVRANSFMVDMNMVFEAEVTSRLRAAARDSSFELKGQYSEWLDHHSSVKIRPDIAVFQSGLLTAIADAKYKTPDIKEVDVGDVYQVLAYAHRFRLKNVHLIYPVSPPIENLMIGDVVVHLHHVDLNTDEKKAQHMYTMLLWSLVEPEVKPAVVLAELSSSF